MNCDQKLEKNGFGYFDMFTFTPIELFHNISNGLYLSKSRFTYKKFRLRSDSIPSYGSLK
jgi:hypothetical protein